MFAVLSDARKVLSRLFIFMSLMWLAACDGVAVPGAGGTGSGQQIDPSTPIPVALLVPHGSANSGEAALARDLESAAPRGERSGRRSHRPARLRHRGTGR